MKGLEEIWIEVIRLNDKYKPQWRDWDVKLFGICLSKESGEVCDKISILENAGTNKKSVPTSKDMAVELIDMMVYSIMFLKWMGVEYSSFLEYFWEKLEVVEKRMIENQKEAG